MSNFVHTGTELVRLVGTSQSEVLLYSGTWPLNFCCVSVSFFMNISVLGYCP